MTRPSREPQILAAALALFAEPGYDATRVRDIAERAGVSEAALYRHHPSMRALALELFSQHLRRYAEALALIAGGRARPLQERIRALSEASLTAFATEPDAFAFVLTHQSRLIAALPADFPYPIRVIESLIREGQQRADDPPGPGAPARRACVRLHRPACAHRA